MTEADLFELRFGWPFVRLSEDRSADLQNNPELWEKLYWGHRDEILAADPDCEAVRRFEPELLDDDEDESPEFEDESDEINSDDN